MTSHHNFQFQNPPPAVKDFDELLKKNPTVFHSARTPRCLQHHWQSLKQFTLLPDQSVQPLPRDNHILNFLDAEANINDGELYEPKDEYIDHELDAADRKAKKEIRHLEAEIQKWQVLVDKVRGDNPPDFDNQTLAVLRGRLVRYLMRSKEVSCKKYHSCKGFIGDCSLSLSYLDNFGTDYQGSFRRRRSQT